MILLLVILWSLCTIYFTHLLCEKKMKIAAIAVAVLDINIVFWTYLVFIIDVSGLGFKESRMAAVFGSDIFHSYVKLRDLS